MPTCHRGRLLDRALASVFVQLEQNWELLVMEDVSDDGSWSQLCDWRCSEHRLACWRQANKGQSSSRNRMLEHARGQWMVFLDSDDEFEPHHLGHRRTAIEASPQVDIWISPMRVVGSLLLPRA